MATNLTVEHGTFIKKVGTGSQVITLTDSGLTPKLMIFYGDGEGTADGIVNDLYSPFKGFCSATEEIAWAASVQSNNKNGSAAIVAKCIAMLDQATGLECQADFTSFAAGSVTINWSQNDTGLPSTRIHYIAIGGSDLTDIKIGTVALNTSTGNQAVSGITSFTPKLGFFMGVQALTALGNQANTGTGFGCAVSSSKRWTIGHGVKGDKGREVFDPTKVMAYPANSDTVLDFIADFVSFDSTGFTINITDAPATADLLAYVLIGGSNLKVDAGTLTSPASTGVQNVTTTHEPQVVGLTTGLTLSGNAYGDNNLQISFGMGVSDTARSNHTYTNPDNKLPESAQDDAFVIQGYIAAATLTASTEDADLDVTPFSATQFDLDWTKVAASAYQYGWFSIGGTEAGAGPSPSSQGVIIA